MALHLKFQLNNRVALIKIIEIPFNHDYTLRRDTTIVVRRVVFLLLIAQSKSSSPEDRPVFIWSGTFIIRGRFIYYLDLHG